ncbi:MAG TPA: hypothetical protein VHP32_06580 [Ignavibacteria bacterium]|nr:hypothetical protein [Ignavibacteria bacterium]
MLICIIFVSCSIDEDNINDWINDNNNKQLLRFVESNIRDTNKTSLVKLAIEGITKNKDSVGVKYLDSLLMYEIVSSEMYTIILKAFNHYKVPPRNLELFIKKYLNKASSVVYDYSDQLPEFRGIIIKSDSAVFFKTYPKLINRNVDAGKLIALSDLFKEYCISNNLYENIKNSKYQFILDLSLIAGQLKWAEYNVNTRDEQIGKITKEINDLEDYFSYKKLYTIRGYIVSKLTDDRYEISFGYGANHILETTNTEYTSRGLFSKRVWKDTDDYVEYEDNYGFTKKAYVYIEATKDEIQEYNERSKKLNNLRNQLYSLDDEYYLNKGKIEILKSQIKRNIEQFEADVIPTAINDSTMRGMSYMNGDTSDKDIVKNIITEWIQATNNKEPAINKFYANNVSYYSWGNVSKNKLMSDKKDFFKKWNYIKLNISNINCSQINIDEYNCKYDKEFDCKNYSNGKEYNGKVASILTFKKIDNNWFIIKETDEKTYFIDKNW